MRTGEASPAELVDAAIARIEATNPELNAVIHTSFDDARERAAGELPDGPFRGVPFLLKDLGMAYAGDPLHMGMRALKEAGFRAPADSTLALRFREAGLVTVGRTNTPELGIVPTTEPVAYGPTRNPWDPSRTAGGSSGGSGAAVAAGLVPFAHASDGGGSIRIPASNNGLLGLKTTRARTTAGPLSGDFASGLSEHFAVTRSVRDAAALLDAIHGPSPGDPYAAPPVARPYVEELQADPGKLRIALLTSSATDADPDSDAIDAVTASAELLTELGHEVEDLDPGAMVISDDLPGSFIKRWAAGMSQTVRVVGRVVGRPLTAEDVEPLTWALVESGDEVSGARLPRRGRPAPADGPCSRGALCRRRRPDPHADGRREAAAAGHFRRHRSGPVRRAEALRAAGDVHEHVQHDRPPRDLGAPALDRGRAPARHPARRGGRGRGRAAPRSRAARKRATVVRSAS